MLKKLLILLNFIALAHTQANTGRNTRYNKAKNYLKIMWVVEKKVGIFMHYLTSGGKFQPGIERASKFPSLEMAQSMAKVHGGIVRELPNN